MTNQQLGRIELLLQVAGDLEQVRDVGREVGIGEIALAVAQAGEVEAQHRDACLVSERLMCAAALMFLVQVKQWAKMAYAKGRPSRGKSSRAPSCSPEAFLMEGMSVAIVR